MTLGQENVRALSVQLLIRIPFRHRTRRSATAGIADDMEALAEDLLMAGAYTDAKTVTRTLALRAGQPKTVGRDACRRALDRLGESLAMRDTTALIGAADESEWGSIREIVSLVGVASVESLRHVVMVETETTASTRAADLIVGFGAPAVSRLAPLVDDSRWFVQRMAARLLGRVGTPEAVPLLLPPVRRSDVRVARDAVAALGAIDDPAAARAIHTVLRTATGDRRRAIVEALVADRDPRVVPMLARIVAESEPLGRDHDIVPDAVAAMERVGSEQAVPVLTR